MPVDTPPRSARGPMAGRKRSASAPKSRVPMPTLEEARTSFEATMRKRPKDRDEQEQALVSVLGNSGSDISAEDLLMLTRGTEA